MAGSTDIQQCDYLHSLKLTHIFTSERAELNYLNEQIRSLDSHISQLNAWRRVLHDRSCQLHNTLAPIRTLPVEVLSHIFQQFVAEIGGFGPMFDRYQNRLGGALVLSSVSSYFRHVAFATPGLWEGIPLHITDDKGICNASALLQHCIALAPSVNISISTTLPEEQAREAVDILFDFEVTWKVKTFELYRSICTSIWVEKLKGSSFGMLDALKITECANHLDYNLRSLKRLTQLNISGSILWTPVLVPQSLQRLEIGCITLAVFLLLLHQSLNLVDCEVYFDFDSFDDLGDYDTQFTQPITHNNLKRLALNVLAVAEMSLLAEKIRLPSIKTLQLDCHEGEFIGAVPLCHSVSATLTTLVLHAYSDALDVDNLYLLCRLPFPKVERLEFWSFHLEPFLNAIHAMALLDGGYSNLATDHLPALKLIELSYGGDVRPRSLLDSLERWRIGQTFHFHIQLDRDGLPHRAWSPDLRRELKSIIGERRVEVMWEGQLL